MIEIILSGNDKTHTIREFRKEFNLTLEEVYDKSVRVQISYQ